MKNFRILVSVAAIGGGLVALSGCQHPATSIDGVPIPPPQAAPSVQAQVQEINNNPHIPAAQKAAIESQISSGSGTEANQTSGHP